MRALRVVCLQVGGVNEGGRMNACVYTRLRARDEGLGG